MKQLSNSEFAIRPTSPSAPMPHLEFVRNGTPTGTVVAGAVMEAAIEWNQLYLVFITDDIPQEDTLRIYLLDPSFNLLDSAKLGTMYSTGAFSGLDLGDPNKVRFRFAGNTTWTLELLPEPILTLPFISDPKGVSRPFRLTRRFKMSGYPKPEVQASAAT